MSEFEPVSSLIAPRIYEVSAPDRVKIMWQGMLESLPLSSWSGARMRFLGPTWQSRNFVVIQLDSAEHWILYYQDQAPETRLRGLAPLRLFCNAKLCDAPAMFSNDGVSTNYVRLIPSPDLPNQIDDLYLRTRDLEAAIKLIASLTTCVSLCNKLVKEIEKSFNREMYYELAASAVSRELTAYAMVYLEASSF